MPLWGKKKKSEKIKDEGRLIDKDGHENRMQGKYEMDRKKNDKSIQTTVADSKGEVALAKKRRSGLKHLLFSKHKKGTSLSSKNKMTSNIGEIPKPIITTDSNDSCSSTARATPLKRNTSNASGTKNIARNKKKTSSSINSIFNRSSKKKKKRHSMNGNSPHRFSYKSEGEESEIGSFASEASNFDSPFDDPPGNAILKEDQNFLAEFNMNDIHTNHFSTSNILMNHDPTLTFQYQEELQKQQFSAGEKNGQPNQAENDHMQHLKVLSEKHLQNKSKSIETSTNVKNSNETRALGDDLTVSTVTSAFLAPGQNNLQNINLITTMNHSNNGSKVAITDNSGGQCPSGIYIPQFPKISYAKNNYSNDIHENFPTDIGVGFETTLSPTTQDLIKDQRRKDKLLSLTRSTLRRASNRSSLPAHLAKRWNVEISPPVLDHKTSQYMFSISVRDRYGQIFPYDNLNDHDAHKQQIPPTAVAKRSLQDFSWLEQSLRNEFHGAILIPLLSMSLGSNGWLSSHSIEKWIKMPRIETLENMIKKMEDEKNKNGVNKKKKDKISSSNRNRIPIERVLSDWLSDILNGVRGHGEIIMHLPNTDIFSSQPMETFLYRNTDPLPVLPSHQSQLQYIDDNETEPTTSDSSPSKSLSNRDAKTTHHSQGAGFITDMVQKSMQCFAPKQDQERRHLKGFSFHAEVGNDNARKPPNSQTVSAALVEKFNCTSRQNDNAIDIEDQCTVTSQPSSPKASKKNDQNLPKSSYLAIHSEVIAAETDLLFHYRDMTILCLNQINSLLIEEDQRNDAWKRLAIALTNLFSFEKDIEESKVGETVKRFSKKKLSKATLESGLRHISRQKKDRTIPSLKVLNSMLEAYLEDLSMVKPSLDSHVDSIVKITNNISTLDLNENESKDVQKWDVHLRHLGQKFGFVKDHIKGLNNSGYQLNFPKVDKINVSAHDSNAQNNLAYKRVQQEKILMNENLFKKSLTMLIKSVPIRFARMSWTFFKLESVQSSFLKAKATKLKTDILQGMLNKSVILEQQQEEKEDDDFELDLVQKILDLETRGITGSSILVEPSLNRVPSDQHEMIIHLADERVGRWNANLAMAVMEAAGVEDAEVRVEEFTRDLRFVRQHAIGLRENLERCIEAVEALMVVTVGDVEDLDENIEVMDGDNDSRGLKRTVSVSSSYEPSSISSQMPLYQRSRNELLSYLAVVFSGSLGTLSVERTRKGLPSSGVLERAGIKINDSSGWLSAVKSEHVKILGSKLAVEDRGNCGKVAVSYFKVREANLSDLLSRISRMLREYVKRVEGIESFVYMHCVGIQLEKHFEKKRLDLVEAWGKKTDITTAINIASKKRLPELVEELNSKLLAFSHVSHTAVKQAKDRHLMSKSIKSDLQDLANRRFQRAKENATERVLSIIKLWLDYEENTTLEEMKTLGEAIREIEKNVTEEDIKADGGPHLFAFIE